MASNLNAHPASLKMLGAGSSGSAILAAGAQPNPAHQEDDVDVPTHADFTDPIYSKGTSRRIFGELYKVMDSLDVIVHVLDANDPLGTQCDSVLEYLRKEKPHKQVIFVLNKCDLIPTWATVSNSCSHSCSGLLSLFLLPVSLPHVLSQVLPPLILRDLHASSIVTAMEYQSAFLGSSLVLVLSDVGAQDLVGNCSGMSCEIF